MRRLRTRKIRTHLERIQSNHGELRGWLHGRLTYLWFGVNGHCAGTLSGQRLRRLAKAIVRHMESEKEEGR
jgi:hypothetical protein